MACDCDDLRKIMALLAGVAKHNDLAEWEEYGSLFAEDAVGFVEVEEGRRGDGHHELSLQVVHAGRQASSGAQRPAGKGLPFSSTSFQPCSWSFSSAPPST